MTRPEYLAIDGCDYHPHCLTCPLPICRYDYPGGLGALLIAMRSAAAVRLRSTGLPVPKIAEKLHLHERTVWRLLRQARQKQNV